MKQIHFKCNTTFVETKPAGRGAKYLNSKEIIDVRSGVEVAIGCVFGPLATAAEGLSRQEVQRTIAISRTQFEHYINLALIRCSEEQKLKESNNNYHSSALAENLTETKDLAEDEQFEGINFEDEEL